MRLKPGKFCKAKLGSLPTKLKKSLLSGGQKYSVACCVKRNNQWVFAGDGIKAPRYKAGLHDIFLLLELVDFEEDGIYSSAAILLINEQTVICGANLIRHANKNDFARLNKLPV